MIDSSAVIDFFNQKTELEKDEYEHVHIQKSIKLCSLSQCVDEKDLNVLIFISCFVHNADITAIILFLENNFDRNIFINIFKDSFLHNYL